MVATWRRERAYPARTGIGTPDLVASGRHTAAVVGVFLVLTVAGALVHRSGAGQATGGSHSDVTRLYLTLIAAEWALVYWVRAGLRSSATPLRILIQHPPVTISKPVHLTTRGNARNLAVDASIAAGVWCAWIAFELARDRWLTPGASSVASLLPQGPLEAILWVVLSISAGFCEELAFRGYLLHQFRALTGRTTAAVVVQALLFGVAHGYQGLAATVSIAAYAVLLGMVAVWRRSLRPGMLAHAWTDIFAGLLAR